MEQSSNEVFPYLSQSQTYTSQLETIKQIQHNLLQMKSRISYFQKQENSSHKKVDKLFQSCIPMIKNKINEASKLQQIREIHQDRNRNMNEKTEEIRASRFKQQLDIGRNMTEMKKTKSYGSFHIREISKKNMRIIAEAKRQWLQTNKKKSQFIKTLKEQSKKKISQFHIQKQKQLKRMKMNQNIQLQNKINKISQSLTKLSEQQRKQAQNYKNSQKYVTKLKKVLNYLHIMKPQLFENIVNKYQLNSQTVLDCEAIQTILIEVEQLRSQKIQQKNKNIQCYQGLKSNLKRYDANKTKQQSFKIICQDTNSSKLNQKRYKSQLPDIQQIYGQNLHLIKKVR